MSVRILGGDCLTVLPTLPSASVDACVTDPPYGLRFMGKGWDHGVPGVLYWSEVLRVLKPGAYLLAFGGTRTYHRLTCAIEDAGFEICDCLSWLYGSGFPKHKSKLKPAHEPIVMARKPAPRATLLNINACRIDGAYETRDRLGKGGGAFVPASGRWPANVLLDEDAAHALDEMTGASRFFYTAKASRAEREAGLDALPKKRGGSVSHTQSSIGLKDGRDAPRGNHHPTVKPVALMRWLVRLVTPPNGVILDPFTGSGTTGVAAVLEDRRFIGIDREPEYVALAEARIARAAEQGSLFRDFMESTA